VNGATALEPFSPGIPLSFSQVPTGLGTPNTFASEFGCSVFSSFEAMSPNLAPQHWGIHGGAAPDTCSGGFNSICQGRNVMAQRNYPCDSVILEYFGGGADFNQTGEAVFKKHLWQCMVGQALNIKVNVETRRAGATFGLLVWQFAEVWSTGK
jgi:beta-mannosidase